MNFIKGKDRFHPDSYRDFSCLGNCIKKENPVSVGLVSNAVAKLPNSTFSKKA
jgi:hypothetical protein